MKKYGVRMLCVAAIALIAPAAMPGKASAAVAGGMLINCELTGYFEDTLTDVSVTVRNITKRSAARAAQRYTATDPDDTRGFVGLYLEETGRYDVGDIVYIECTANDRSGRNVCAAFRGSRYAKIDSYYPTFNLNVFRNVCSPMSCN